VFDSKPVTRIGLDEPVFVYEPGVEVTVNDVAFPPLVAGVNATEALPLLNARADPEFVATGDVGIPAAVFGSHHPASYTSRNDVSVL
jgi:hypothetical protein